MYARNTFTEEAVAFAVNQQMNVLTENALRRWAPDHRPSEPLTVGVLNAGNIPFADLQDFVAVLLSGHRYLGRVSTRSPALLPAFAADLTARIPEISVEFSDVDGIFQRAGAIISTGSEATVDRIAARCEEHCISSDRRFLRGHRFSVAIVDGRESPLELEGLAEDALLHEGFGCRNVAIIWAPSELEPDAALAAFARFRGVFPAHAKTPGRLKMQQAFLDAVGAPHAYGDGLEFLMSKGAPEPQQPGHVRWTEYGSREEVEEWIARNRKSIQVVVMREEVRRQFDMELPVCVPGDTQRPALDWRPDSRDVMTFLTALS